MEIRDDYIVLNADDEYPNCMQCNNCFDDYSCEKCGAKYGWANYERIVTKDKEQ